MKWFCRKLHFLTNLTQSDGRSCLLSGCNIAKDLKEFEERREELEKIARENLAIANERKEKLLDRNKL